MEMLAATSVIICASWRISTWLRTPSRPFVTAASVSSAYDDWTSEGILEYFWGEHIHLGYYEVTNWFNSDKTLTGCFFSGLFDMSCGIEAFRSAKENFVARMCEFGRVCDIGHHLDIADIGCGIGGTSRVLAQTLDSCAVKGISISARQIERAIELTAARGMKNVNYELADAVHMPLIKSETFDVVWICESSEHVSDKAALLREACRILRPGGRLVMAAWCCREPRNVEEKWLKKYLEDEWSHPRFASIAELSQILTEDIGMEELRVEDWTIHTLPSWYHSILVGIWSPWIVVSRPHVWLKTIREIYTICLMHRAFTNGLMQYGMFAATKTRK